MTNREKTLNQLLNSYQKKLAQVEEQISITKRLIRLEKSSYKEFAEKSSNLKVTKNSDVSAKSKVSAKSNVVVSVKSKVTKKPAFDINDRYIRKMNDEIANQSIVHIYDHSNAKSKFFVVSENEMKNVIMGKTFTGRELTIHGITRKEKKVTNNSYQISKVIGQTTKNFIGDGRLIKSNIFV